MAVCDAHGAACGLGKQRQLKRGQGYLLAATFMRKSVIQDKNVDQGAALGFSRDDYRREIERVQGEGPWLICDDCLKLLNLSRADKEAAHKAAQQWWKDNNTPGYDPDADLIEGAEKLPQARAAQPSPPAAPSAVYVGKMHCPRCGAENDAARAACWNCFAQLRPPAGAEIRRPKPKPVKPERKKEKAAPAPPPVAEPVIPLAPIEAEPAPAKAEPAPVEMEQAPAQVEEAPPVAPLEIPPIMATVEPIEAEPEGEQVFVAGVPLRELPAPEEEPAPAVETEPAAEPAVPETEVEEEPAPIGGKVFDLDEPVTDSAYVIPGLAEREAEPELEPGQKDVEPLVDLGGPVLDLDAPEPEQKPDDKKPKDKR